MTSYETLSVTKDDGIAWVALNRPAVRNAINKQMQAELHEVWHEFRYDDEVRCVVLSGEGDAFCTGIDRGEEAIVGVNRYQPENPEHVDVLAIDNTEVRRAQIAGLERVRAERDDRACHEALDRLTAGAAGDGNLLALCIEAARARATVGEMSDAMEKVFGRHRAEIRSIQGVYGGNRSANLVWTGSPNWSARAARSDEVWVKVFDAPALAPHGSGLAWFEATGATSFTRHDILPDMAAADNVSQLHALVAADVNLDGLADLVAGKRVVTRDLIGKLAPGDHVVHVVGGCRLVEGDPDVANLRTRLFPPAYEDPERDREFRQLVGDDLLRQRLAAGDTAMSTLEDGHVRARHWVVDLDDEQVQSWLSVLHDLRLVLAQIVGIASEAEWDRTMDGSDPAQLVLWHVGVLQEELLELLMTGLPDT